ncbi:hypothetical protein E2F50_22450 [Rhizobium deserti]|uniref:ATP-grasp domain-containing protein n=1 Tax=Rhizobium deserti TaxID=2547961 RepID=A0A4R5U6A6_9HYPH|nr:hypothetical protein [Rhizobium deserti]TDK29604.1 hypothetical protein E2F50_22450 [Rhizobium deserti]
MLESHYRELRSIVGRYDEAVVLTAFENWPAPYRERALAIPIHSLPVSLRGLNAIVGQKSRSGMPCSSDDMPPFGFPRDFSIPSEQEIFPKIGPVSWKEVEAFRIMKAGDLEHCLPILLTSMTSRMRLILEPFISLGMPTFLHLFPAVNLTDFIEARLTVKERQIVSARWQRLPEGFAPNQTQKQAVMELAIELAEESPISDMYIDLCIDVGSPDAPARLVEINPVMAELSQGGS